VFVVGGVGPCGYRGGVSGSELDEFLAPLPADRAESVKAWLGSAIRDCAACGLPILVSEPHELVKDDLFHRSCVPA
jgi:hypothetical protein